MKRPIICSYPQAAAIVPVLSGESLLVPDSSPGWASFPVTQAAPKEALIFKHVSLDWTHILHLKPRQKKKMLLS